MKITDTHVYFWRGIYSNWYLCQFIDPISGRTFSSTEQAFMYYKAKTFGDDARAELVMQALTPKEAKDIGREVAGYDEKTWSNIRMSVMIHVNYLKFDQNHDIFTELMATEDKILVEASPYDLIWGVGLGEEDSLILDQNNWRGANLLGKALMQVRKSLKTFVKNGLY